ncbi:MAG: DNA-directed polymerase sigma-70 factor [Frankiales bacterium]|nr:DNA-directed polymerase sigma-70 factor [Frankiales bacterium]
MVGTGSAAMAMPPELSSTPATRAAMAIVRDDVMVLLEREGADERARTNEPVITQAPFVGCWPQAAAVLRRFLIRRGTNPADAEDLVQECALRVLSHEPSYRDADDLLRWCLPVVRNLSVDSYRRTRRDVPTDRIPDQPSHRDLHEEVEHRAELERVLGAMAQLRPHDRHAILSAVQDEPTAGNRREAVRDNVRRHRARQRLTALLSALLGFAVAAVRRTGTTATVLPAVLAAFAIAVAVGGSGRPGSAGAAPAAGTALPEDAVSLSAVAPAQRLAPRPHAPVTLVRRAPDPRTPVHSRQVQRVQAPTGETVSLRTSDARPAHGGLVCTAGVPGLPDTCLTAPPRSSRGAAVRTTSAVRHVHGREAGVDRGV